MDEGQDEITNDTVTLLVGPHRHLDSLRADQARLVRFTVQLFAPAKAISAEFPAMVRTQPYDYSEMAIATYFQARAAGHPLVLLPVVLLARSQHDALVYSSAAGPVTVPDLPGTRIAIRSYSQTTGMWLRGMIDEGFGIADAELTWLTTSPSHVPHVPDPANATRISDGRRPVDLLRDGTAVAAVLGPEDEAPDLACVFGDAAAADRRWITEHGCIPINHVLVARDEPRVVERAADVVELMKQAKADSRASETPERDAWLRGVGLDPWPQGLPAMLPALELAYEYCRNQGLIDATSRLDDLLGPLAGL